MTDDVAALVLRDNYFQTQVLSVIEPHRAAAARRAAALHPVPGEERPAQPRASNILPSDEEIAERRAQRQGTRPRPKRAVLLAYSKIWLYDELLASPLPDDPWVATALARYFPHGAARARTPPTCRGIR